MEPPHAQQLRTLLQHARDTTEFYAPLLPSLETVPPEAVGRLLASLPLLSRQDVRRERMRLLSFAGDETERRVVRSTGTTGEPVEVVQDGNLQRVADEVLGRHIDRCLGAGASRGLDLIALALHGGASSRTVMSPWSPDHRAVKWNFLRAWQRDDPGFLHSLACLAGTVVTMLPSVAELVAGRLRRTGLAGTIRPALIVLSGECLDGPVRRLVAENFACSVTQLYAVSEAGILGSECPTDGGFHVEGQTAHVEIVDEHGRPAPEDCEGEVVATPLANRAMPLIRYRSGDRATWIAGRCGCGRAAPRLRLNTGRRPARLLSATGATVNVVRFAKLFAQLDVERFGFEQDLAGAVRVVYQARQPLSTAVHSLMTAAVRQAVGPGTEVRIERLDRLDSMPLQNETAGTERAEPAGPELPELRQWLHQELCDLPGLDAALLLGSALDPEVATRFSDIDLVLLLEPGSSPARCLEPVRRLVRLMPGISVSVDFRPELESRAPLLACRLRSEGLVVAGNGDVSLLPQPSGEDLRRQARFWAQQAKVAVWQRLTSPAPNPSPIWEAWSAGKLLLDALRFLALLRGHTDTRARAVVASVSGPGPDGLLATAREHIPPPPAEPTMILSYWLEALKWIEALADACRDSL
jgi:phenylacetate-CoA ligase